MGQGGRSAKACQQERPTRPTRIVIAMRNKTEWYEPTGGGKRPEEYRRLAEHCREIARNVSAANDRGDLLARAQTWDLIAERLGRAATEAISGAAH
jgi:hypothetical protein